MSMTPQEQLIQANAKELLRIYWKNYSESKTEWLEETESFLTTFATQIEMTTREEDAKICETNTFGGLAHIDKGQGYAKLIRSKITKI